MDSGDAVADAAARKRFLEYYEEFYGVRDEGKNRKILVIGSVEYPFPIPLVSENGIWRFDIAEGLDEILTRRIL